MKVFIALIAFGLAVAAQGSYVDSWNGWNGWNNGWNKGWNNGWSNGWNGWNNGWNSWDDHSSVAWPAYGHSWPTYGKAWNGWYAPKTTVVQANVAKVDPWGLAWGSYGHGYNNYLGGVPTAKYVAVNPGSVHVAPLVGHAVSQKLIVA
ncbi:bifunctional endo-1,4-beta-xylanase XylA [Wyeomyia smithii]|uniref:bifunctional endo-1,4-beta-xylanase XylA n=1 Tax=Wyeomyia smithii TaxID=174621 RepID=UPI0024680378|nr:bifunctional endo-1,4-beta-xylanase XylA [Wyeomyia smithii]